LEINRQLGVVKILSVDRYNTNPTGFSTQISPKCCLLWSCGHLPMIPMPLLPFWMQKTQRISLICNSRAQHKFYMWNLIATAWKWPGVGALELDPSAAHCAILWQSFAPRSAFRPQILFYSKCPCVGRLHICICRCRLRAQNPNQCQTQPEWHIQWGSIR